MEQIREYFIPIKEISQNLCCKICTYVAISAVECQTCEQLYCEDCAKLWQRKKDQCPDCKGEFKVKQPHRLIREELSKLAFSCKNDAQGCKAPILMNDVLRHAEECQFKNVKCPCGWSGPQLKQKQHEQTCQQFATKQCNICKEDIKLVKYQTHNCFLELKQQFEKITEKFYEYKETSEYSIKELKNHASKESNELQSVKQQIKGIVQENNELRKQMTDLTQVLKNQEQQFKQVIESQQQQQQQQQQGPFLTQGKLVESRQFQCAKSHWLQYWMNPNGEEKTKKCFRCQKTQVNCRYCCPLCCFFVCLKCQEPELTKNPHENSVLCPARHKVTKKIMGLKCTVCDKTSVQMKQPGGADCTECDFAICFECLENERYKSRVQQCPVQ
ncbi:unnamed protein product (macronuclear) [Paramecium tetraurelia]|uniref:RING-type domain-containing protein n=1 Tax=Paramecium tetraurelia TaxID=5888 RepID=A0E751_PARTE|nr:uncharacterized protein GSPATT00023846001 [Paramecium tetraurelia]CAK91118.1 unnamed protein product [Paramecium tetraurelia]|eukprot:XP_001458515.1 hypothetical protein (macronuclear) [Paramecium tetraurelia strain d4-2]